MSDTLYRSTELSVAEDVAGDTAGGITGIAVPYGEVSPELNERFQPGVFPDGATGPLYAEHSHLQERGRIAVGTYTGRNTPDGYVIDAEYFNNDNGQQARQQAADGTHGYLSIGFVPVDVHDDDGTMVHTSAELLEVSQTSNPAYRGAKIVETRALPDVPVPPDPDAPADPDPQEDEEDMTDIAELDESIKTMQTRMDAIADAIPKAPAKTPEFRSLGHALKAALAGDDSAKTLLTRAADQTPPATAAQAAAEQNNAWVSEAMAFQRNQRPLMTFFSSGPLPEKGNAVEYPGAPSTSATGDGVQDSEGAVLDYVELEIVPASAPVVTYGNYAKLTRQAIERGDASYVNGVLEFQGLMYNRDTEAAFRTAMIAASTSTRTIADLSAETRASLIAYAMEDAGQIEDTSLGLTAEAMLVSRDVYGVLAGIFDWDYDGNGQSFTGSAGVVRQGGNIGDLPVIVVPKFGTLQMHVVSSQGYRSWESSGAPYRLQDEDITNLTKDFSLYGYMAHGVKDAAGLVRSTITAL